MKLQDNKTHSNKIDVILHGIETIGSAERSVDPEAMREKFYSISGGFYSNLLFSQFGKDRVEKELDEFLKKDFFKRSGGGIGITRMIRAMKLSKLLDCDEEKCADTGVQTEDVPVDGAPSEDTPVDGTPSEDTPVDGTPSEYDG